MIIRYENSEDAARIRILTDAAFEGVEHSDQTEGAIVDALRAANALVLSLVVEQDHEIVAHVAFSPVQIDGLNQDWVGLGPVSVSPNLQRTRIGTVLIKRALELLTAAGTKGCVVLGDPEYYRRFGFKKDPALRYSDAPAEYFQSIPLNGDTPSGEVTYHQAFSQ